MTSSSSHATVEEMAQILQVTPSKLAQLRYKGGGPPFLRLGRQIRYPLDKFDAWEKDNILIRTDTRFIPTER
ncbi:helix-turn-helix domain-containing protein [Rhodococcus sp. NPDC006774]|uniref:helix-turn-helix domain-containing protein n=1 Tax=Rhodococcus sp. NPDC006774 TaxID=3157186 RepID=UPI0033DA948B